MKKYLNSVFLFSLIALSVMLLPCTHSVQAQDLLVTIHRDSMNCKIGTLTDDFYPIEFKLDNELMTGMIHKDSIMFFRKNMFRSIDDNRLRPWYPTVALGMHVGGGRQFGPLRVGLTEDLNPKAGSSSDRNLFYVGTDLAVFLSSRIGYGLKYHFRSMLGGDIQQHYIGPMLTYRFWDNERKNHWIMQFSAGYGRMTHNNAMVKIGTKEPEPILLTSNSLAGDIAMGYNLKLSPHLSTQVKLSLTVAYPDHVKIFDYARINPGGANPLPDISGYCHNMNSLNLSVGIGFH
ncbi:MAG: hypothetical protein PHX50_13950 [Massilibacteroides sp.]|nr:hypothetical protein [Massilibacteroides sp.]